MILAAERQKSCEQLLFKICRSKEHIWNRFIPQCGFLLIVENRHLKILQSIQSKTIGFCSTSLSKTMTALTFVLSEINVNISWGFYRNNFTTLPNNQKFGWSMIFCVSSLSAKAKRSGPKRSHSRPLMWLYCKKSDNGVLCVFYNKISSNWMRMENDLKL